MSLLRRALSDRHPRLSDGRRKLTRRLAPFAAGLAILAGIPMVAAGPASAVDNTGQFEMDGNIAHNAATTPPYDWASLFGSAGQRLIAPDPVNGPLLASAFVPDFTTPDQTYFASNKDTQPISQWSCMPQSTPTAKDDLTNAYAALVKVPVNAPENAGDTVLFMGSERKSNSGSSFAGFWFLQNPVGCTGTASFTGGGHTNGDILVVNNFVNGGTTPNIQLFQWHGNDATGSLVPIANGGLCGSSSPDNACSIPNSTTISSPWPPASNAATADQPNTFVESGIDLTKLVGGVGQSPCFSTFMAETRSSPQLSATLKDFAGGSQDGGQFLTCPAPAIGTTATPGGTVAPGSSQNDAATAGTVSGRPTPTGTIQFTLCGPSQVTSAGCPQGVGTAVGSPVTVNAGAASSSSVTGNTSPNDLAPGKYCWGAAYAPDAASSTQYSAGYDTNATTECFTIFQAAPSLKVVKAEAAGGPNPVTAAGQVIPYTFTVTNNGNETLTNVSVADTGVAPAGNVTATCQSLSNPTGTCSGTTVASLAPGQTANFGGSYTVTQADINAGSVADSAVANGTNPAGGTTTSPPSTLSIPVTQSGALTTTKTQSAGPDPITAAGQTVTYTFTVRNTGNVTLTNVSVTDTGTSPAGNLTTGPTCGTAPAGDSCTNGVLASLAPGQSATFTGTYVVTQADIDHGSVTDSAVANGTAPGNVPVTSPPGTLTIPVTQTPGLTTTKTLTGGPNPVTAAGQTLTYTFSVKNTGNVTLTNVSVHDSGVAPAGNLTTGPTCGTVPAGDTCTNGVVASLSPGQTATFTGTYVVTQADINNGSITDNATASGTPPGGGTTTSPPSTVTVPVTQTAGLLTVKSETTGGPNPITAAGQVVPYTFTVTNNGNVTLTNVSLTDTGVAPAGGLTTGPTCGTVPAGDSCTNGVVASLAPGQSATFTGTYTVTQADIDHGSVADSAVAKGTNPSGGTTTSPPGTLTIPVTQTPGLTTAKAQTGGPNPITAAGQTVTYTFTVKNTGNVTLTNVSVSDTGTPPAGNLTTGPTCGTVPAGDTCTNGVVASLAPGQTATFTGTYVVTQADIDHGSVTDSAVSKGTNPGGGTTTSPPGTTTIPVTQEPALTVQKALTGGPDPVTAVGQTLTYTFTVTNTGNVTITNVSVSDHPVPPAGNLTTGPTCGSVPTGDSCTNGVVASLAPGQTATFTGTYVTTQADLDNGSISDVGVCTGTPPGGGTTMCPPSPVTVPVTQTPALSLLKTASPTTVDHAGETVTYSFKVTNTGNVTVNNISIDDVQASPSSNASLSPISCPQSSLAPTASETCTATYTVTQADMNNGSITDTATASGQTPQGTTVTSNPSSATVKAVQVILSGRAFALGLQANLAGVALVGPETVQDTGGQYTTQSTSTPVPCEANANVLDVVLTGDVCAGVTTVAAPNASSTATSSVANAAIGISTIPVIDLQVVQSQSTTTCSGSSGSVTIAFLSVGGVVLIKKPTAVAPNTTLNVGVVKLILNQQIPFSNAADSGLTVNAVVVQVNALGLAAVNVVVASSTSDINCSGQYKPPILTGEANDVNLTAALAGTSILGDITVNDSGPVITNAASVTAPCVASAAVTDVAFTGDLCSSVTTTPASGTTPAQSTAAATVASITIGIPTLPVITAQAVESISNTSCAGSAAKVTIAFLQVGSTVVIATPTQIGPNTHLTVGPVTLTLNQQIPFSGADQGLTVNAIAVNVNAPGLAQANLTIASSTSDIIGCT